MMLHQWSRRQTSTLLAQMLRRHHRHHAFRSSSFSTMTVEEAEVRSTSPPRDMMIPLPPLPDCSQPLGAPMPVDEHACSVSLPTWSAVVGYEEGNPTVTQAMQCGYPRFVYHPYVLQLMRHISEQHADAKEDCLLMPSIYAARRCQIFLLRSLLGDDAPDDLPDPALVGRLPAHVVEEQIRQTSASSKIRVVSINTQNRAEVHAVIFPATTAAGTQAKAYWQHTGEVVSSRRAQACLQDLGVPLQKTVTIEQYTCHEHGSVTPDSVDDAFTQLRTSLAGWARTAPDDVFLTPSGMSAVYVALQAARRRHLERHPEQQGGRSIVYGFPYLDTLKLCSRSELCPDGVEFFGRADAHDLAALESYLECYPDGVSVVMTEVPSNPLLHCPDVVRLRELANRYDFLLVVDDTIANYLNVNLLESGLADATVSSLTKLVSGRGDGMAGAVACSPHTPGGRWMQQDLSSSPEGKHSGLYCPDTIAIYSNSRDFAERNDQINETAEGLAEWLNEQESIERVYYPKLSHSSDLYHQVQSGGYGGLFSIVLAPNMCERTFYDALDVCKGPSLGTNFTLACPYTLLAHYHELDFAMSYDVPPNLIRVAVGLEPLHVLQEKFTKALSSSRLYPKVCLDSVEKRKQGQPAKRQFSTSSCCHHNEAGKATSCFCAGNNRVDRHTRTASMRGWTPSRFGSLCLSTCR